jgi:ADP-heptose:LPS heptosyltransferase
MTVLERLSEGANVCFIRLRSMGDCVLTTPAIALLHAARPDLKITVAVEDHFAPIFTGNPALCGTLQPSVFAVRKSRPHLCINFHGGSRSLWMALFSGAKWRAGFAHHNFTFAYNLKIPRAQSILGVNRTVHTAEHLASAVFALGVAQTDIPRAQLFVDEQAATSSPLLASLRGKRYAALHPFAAASNKVWPSDRFCELARYLRLWNFEPVFLAGQSDDTSPFRDHPVFCGSLEQTKALISGASLFVGNDSGPAHIAAAFGVPTAVLFGPSKPAIWSPWRTESEIIVAPGGLNRLPVARVITALERLRLLEEAHA